MYLHKGEQENTILYTKVPKVSPTDGNNPTNNLLGKIECTMI